MTAQLILGKWREAWRVFSAPDDGAVNTAVYREAASPLLNLNVGETAG
jgi:hypothetical protein